jgi:hypothetical protein
MQIGFPALVFLIGFLGLLGLLITAVIDNYKIIFKWLLGIVGVAFAMSVATGLGMALKAIFHLD